jgi:ureidoglycolate hydrolase
MPESPRRVRARRLATPAWAPFGWVPRRDTDPRDGTSRLAFEWADPHVNIIGHARDEVASVPGGLRCDVLYRHLTHTQVLMPLDHRCVLAVAPPDLDFDRTGAGDAVAAFVLEPLEAVVLHRGTWHWGPFPVAAPAVTLFNVQGLRYAEDNGSVDLTSRGLSVEVLTDEPAAFTERKG